jgi:hypothetical protein
MHILQYNNVNLCKRSVFWEGSTNVCVLLYPHAGYHSLEVLILGSSVAYTEHSRNVDTNTEHMEFGLIQA